MRGQFQNHPVYLYEDLQPGEKLQRFECFEIFPKMFEGCQCGVRRTLPDDRRTKLPFHKVLDQFEVGDFAGVLPGTSPARHSQQCANNSDPLSSRTRNSSSELVDRMENECSLLSPEGVNPTDGQELGE